MSSRRRYAVWAVIGLVVVLAFAMHVTKLLALWCFALFFAVNLAILLTFGVPPLVNGIRFGPRRELDEILSEQDPVRRVRLLRHHLGWSPGKIAAELNRRNLTNRGIPWQAEDVRRTVKGIRGVL